MIIDYHYKTMLKRLFCATINKVHHTIDVNEYLL